MATEQRPAEPSDLDLEKTYLYHQLDEYPWDTDQEFQGGLRAILGSVQEPDQVQHLTLRAKCYYYARKVGAPVDFDGYKQWVESQKNDSSVNGAVNDTAPASNAPNLPLPAESNEGGVGGFGEAPKPASFAEICDMIAEGKPIPGIKDIPDTILEGQASETQTAKRKKPWEKDAGVAEKPSWMT